jgi:hypothetical protein
LKFWIILSIFYLFCFLYLFHSPSHLTIDLPSQIIFIFKIEEAYGFSPSNQPSSNITTDSNPTDEKVNQKTTDENKPQNQQSTENKVFLQDKVNKKIVTVHETISNYHLNSNVDSYLITPKKEGVPYSMSKASKIVTNDDIIATNSLWTRCNIGITNQTTQYELNAMKYFVEGSISLNDFANELDRFNANKSELKILLDFNKNTLGALISPKATQNQLANDTSDTPDELPFIIKEAYTSCIYQTPIINPGLETPEIVTTVNERLNPPFEKCRNNESTIYSIEFNIDKTDKDAIKKFANFEDHRYIRFVIYQSFGNLPEGALTVDPYVIKEERIDLNEKTIFLNLENILTHCIRNFF